MMRKLFEPIDFSDPDKCFWDAVKCLAIAAVMMTVVVLLVAGWNLMTVTKKMSASEYSSYYSASEYRRLTKKQGQTPYYYDAQGRKCKLM